MTEITEQMRRLVEEMRRRGMTEEKMDELRKSLPPPPGADKSFDHLFVYVEENMIWIRKNVGDVGVRLYIDHVVEVWNRIIGKGDETVGTELRKQLEQLAETLP